LYPAPAVNPQTTTTSILTLTELATGTWTAAISATLTITQDDDLVLLAALNESVEAVVTCAGTLCGLDDCIHALYTKHMDALNCGSTSPYQRYVDGIALLYPLAKESQACGNQADYENYYNQMVDLLSASGTDCACNCCSSGNGPQWVDNASQTGTPAFEALYAAYLELQQSVDNIPEIIGPQGPVGPQGPQGYQGEDGINGTNGADGAPGANGSTGSTGTTGPQGPEGPMGPAVPAGLTWQGYWDLDVTYQTYDVVLDDSNGIMTSYVLIDGPLTSNTPPAFDTLHWIQLAAAGPTGSQGPMGPAGTNGTNGVDGVNGVTGPEGPQGIQGEQGPIGPQGPIGLTGDTGPQGPTGPAGVGYYKLAYYNANTISCPPSTLTNLLPAATLAVPAFTVYRGLLEFSACISRGITTSGATDIVYKLLYKMGSNPTPASYDGYISLIGNEALATQNIYQLVNAYGSSTSTTRLLGQFYISGPDVTFYTPSFSGIHSSTGGVQTSMFYGLQAPIGLDIDWGQDVYFAFCVDRAGGTTPINVTLDTFKLSL
jgi:hypothetical protein